MSFGFLFDILGDLFGTFQAFKKSFINAMFKVFLSILSRKMSGLLREVRPSEAV